MEKEIIKQKKKTFTKEDMVNILGGTTVKSANFSCANSIASEDEIGSAATGSQETVASDNLS